MGHTPVKVMIFSIRMQINGFPRESFARVLRKCVYRAKITANWKFRTLQRTLLFLLFADGSLTGERNTAPQLGYEDPPIDCKENSHLHGKHKPRIIHGTIGNRHSWSAPMITYWISSRPHVSLSSGFHYKLHSVRLPSALSPCSLLNYCGQLAVASPLV